MKKSLLTILAALFLATFSCSNGDIDVKKDYTFVKAGETTSLYGKKFVPTHIGDVYMDYRIIDSESKPNFKIRRLFLGTDYHLFPPDTSTTTRLVEIHANRTTCFGWGIIESYQIERGISFK